MTISNTDFQRLMYAMYSVRHGQLWGRQVGLEYWLQPSALSQGVGTFTDGVFAATNNGWTNTGTILGVSGTGADFPLAAHNTYAVSQASGDLGTPAHFAIDTADDILQSPAIFGDPAHMAIAAELAGMPDLPTKLIMDSWTRFSVINTSSDTSGFGFTENGGVSDVAADSMAHFRSNGTSFTLSSGAADSSALATADTNPHRFRIVIDRLDQLAYAYIDDMATSLGSIALQNDLWPVSFGAGILTSTGANFIQLGPTRIRYAWKGWA